MTEEISAAKIKIPARFDIFMTLIGLVGLVTSLYLFWITYLPSSEVKTPYGFFIGFTFAVSSSFFLFGLKFWYKRHKDDLDYEKKKRKLELKKKKLENEKLMNEIKK